MPSDVTIFTQDGIVYYTISHHVTPKELETLTAIAIRDMAKVPRSEMKVVTYEEARTMIFGKPKEMP